MFICSHILSWFCGCGCSCCNVIIIIIIIIIIVIKWIVLIGQILDGCRFR